MLPPTDVWGNNSYVSCWYHVSGCPPYGPYGPNAIDWLTDPGGGSHHIWQRSRVWPQDPNYSVYTSIGSSLEDGYGCDYFNITVRDYTNLSLQGTMTYVHAYTDHSAQYTIQPSGTIANWRDGIMSDDDDCTKGWTDYHVHEKSSSTEWLNPVCFPAAVCHGPAANNCQNSDLYNVTRAFIW